MTISPFTPHPSEPVSSTFAIEPVYNNLVAMSLLTGEHLALEQEPWLSKTAARLSASQRHHNQILFNWLGAALIPDANHTTFTQYLRSLSTKSSAELQNRVLDHWAMSGLVRKENAGNVRAGLDQLLQETVASVADPQVAAEARELLSDPPAMQRLMTEHLTLLWHDHFESEWESKLNVMRFITEELNARTRPTGPAIAVMQAFLRRAIPHHIHAQLAGVRQITFVPSPNIQLFVSRLGTPDRAWVFMLADFWQWPLRTEPIKRSEVMSTAAALSDDTRLRILELLAAHHELKAQEIIALLDATQSTVSRHLKQLSSARFIDEKRAGDANKIYRLNQDRVGELAHMLSRLLSTENAQAVLNDVRLKQPEILRPFMDRNGLITTWPAKQKAQKAVLEYLIDRFEPDETYSEQQVNDLITQWHTYDDPPYLRRALVDFGLLKRRSDGSEYWRA